MTGVERTWGARLTGASRLARPLVMPLLDYALPPRCPACGEITSTPDAFCAACWQTIDFIGAPLCDTCGVELPAIATGEPIQCGACLADPPPFARARAVMRYGDVGRTIAHRLKYGRRVTLARVMAAQMQRLLSVAQPEGACLVPVPLHRWRIWSRGFNQAALIARHLSRLSDVPVEADLLRRTVNTPPLHALGARQRERTMRCAIALRPGAPSRLAGRTVILIDDIWTTGATASSCARLLMKGGAARVEVLCWTRVSRPGD